jgi:hypothetical protein
MHMGDVWEHPPNFREIQGVGDVWEHSQILGKFKGDGICRGP